MYVERRLQVLDFIFERARPLPFVNLFLHWELLKGAPGQRLGATEVISFSIRDLHNIPGLNHYNTENKKGRQGRDVLRIFFWGGGWG